MAEGTQLEGSKVTSVEVRARWRTPEGEVLAAEVLARLIAGRPLEELELGEVDGRVDLRGLPVPLPQRLARYETAGWFIEKLAGRLVVAGVPVRGLDLSGAFLDELIFRDCAVEDCVLDKASCRRLGMWKCVVRNVSFRGARMRDFNPSGNEFSHVSFVQADLRGAFTVIASFTDCDFSGARLDKLRFTRCGLVRCRFSGVLDEVIFDGRIFDEEGPNYYEDVDMSGAVFRLTEFWGFNLAAVKLPDTPGLRVIENYPCVLRRAMAALDGGTGESARVLKAILAGPARTVDQGWPLGLFNRDDFLRLGGEEMAVLADNVFREAGRECDTSV